MKSRCGFCSKLGYCEGVVEEFGGEVGELGGEASPPVDETLVQPEKRLAERVWLREICVVLCMVWIHVHW